MMRIEPAPLWRRWELPTWGLAAAIYGAWLALTWWHAALPWWSLLLAGGWLVCWHGHLQHEALHGHPSRRVWLNEALVFPALGLFYPYSLYRETHLAHHLDWRLTCPIDDPESFYVTPGAWQRMGGLRRAVLTLNMTLAGRLLIGPFLATWSLYAGEVRRLVSGDASHLSYWLRHGAGVALVLLWVVAICGMPLWSYVLLFALPALSLTLLRSYAEHRPARQFEHRIAINRAEGPFAALFLNNNMHAVHHAVPGLAWYDVPAFYREQRAAFERGNGGFVWHGYRDLARRYMFHAKDTPVHPFFDESHCAPAPAE